MSYSFKLKKWWFCLLLLASSHCFSRCAQADSPAKQKKEVVGPPEVPVIDAPAPPCLEGMAEAADVCREVAQRKCQVSIGDLPVGRENPEQAWRYCCVLADIRDCMYDFVQRRCQRADPAGFYGPVGRQLGDHLCRDYYAEVCLLGTVSIIDLCVAAMLLEVVFVAFCLYSFYKKFKNRL